MFTIPSATQLYFLTPAILNTTVGFVLDIATSTTHFVALLADGTVATWGVGSSGRSSLSPCRYSVSVRLLLPFLFSELGYPFASVSPNPTVIPGLTGVIKVFADTGRSAVITYDAKLIVFGTWSAFLSTAPTLGLVQLNLSSTLMPRSPWSFRSGCIKQSNTGSQRILIAASDRYGKSELLAVGSNTNGELLTGQPPTDVLLPMSEFTEVQSKYVSSIACTDGLNIVTTRTSASSPLCPPLLTVLILFLRQLRVLRTRGLMLIVLEQSWT